MIKNNIPLDLLKQDLNIVLLYPIAVFDRFDLGVKCKQKLFLLFEEHRYHAWQTVWTDCAFYRKNVFPFRKRRIRDFRGREFNESVRSHPLQPVILRVIACIYLLCCTARTCILYIMYIYIYIYLYEYADIRYLYDIRARFWTGIIVPLYTWIMHCTESLMNSIPSTR
jgi:hypothetical protein